MSPRLALVIYTIFIGILFQLEKKHYGGVRLSIWPPFLFIIMLSSRPIILWLNPGGTSEQNDAPGSPYDQVFYILLILAGLFISSKRIVKLRTILKTNIWVIVIFAFCGLSILWSDAPRASFNAWVKVMVLLLMITIILTESDPLEAIIRIFRRASFVLIPLSILLIKYFPIYGRTYSPWSGTAFYGGVTTYKNGLGFLCLVFGVFLLWDMINLIRSKPLTSIKILLLINLTLIGMIVWLLYMANSSTSTATTIVGAFMIIAMELPIVKKHVNKIDILVIILLSIALLVFATFNVMESLVATLGRDMTLTGRTDIWKRVLGVYVNPLIGTGYASFWLGERSEFLFDLNWQKLNQSHNGFIEVYLNLGFIGLSLLIMMIIKAYKNLKINLLNAYQYGKFQFICLVVILMTNITEASYTINSIPWFIVVLTAFNVPLERGD